MTRVDKSPEQLDAEAAAPVDFTALAARIVTHRLAYRDELPLRLTSSSVPEDVEPIAVHAKVGDEWRPTGAHLDVQDAGELGGPALSPALVAYVTEPPRGYLWAGALFALAVHCRRSHSEHQERDEWRGSLCHALVYEVAVAEEPFDKACFELGLIPSQSVKTLSRALEWMDEHMRLRREQQGVQRASDLGGTVDPTTGMISYPPPVAPHLHRPLDGMHREDCPQCRKVA